MIGTIFGRLTIASDPENTSTLKIGVLFDYTDTMQDEAQPGEIFIPPISLVFKCEFNL